ncbi:MAG: N-methylhydantoinase A [Gammaproteobacteria bacterium]|jgi:N-methylhydantoinase A
MGWTLAIETGGTFTDVFMVAPDGAIYTDKVPSTPAAPEQAAATAFARGLALGKVDPSAVTRVLHGSTVAVNALIERRGARPALIATRGFRDMLFIGRQEKTHIYDMFYQKPLPFIDRADVFEVTGRIAADGSVVQAIDRDEVAEVVEHLIERSGAQTIAVCLLHAYANASHEQLVADVIRERYPHLHVVLSSDVCPVHREFERASTTVINAVLHPVVDSYLSAFADLVAESGCAAAPLIMQANGGVLPVEASRRRPAGLYLSGPSAAVAGAAELARQAGLPSLITLDVGGTSTDICLVTNGEVHESGHGGACGVVQGQPLNMVMTDIVTIGAGGGSLAWVDAGGMLKVGPHSAGADPGPACYARGGDGFTLSDALISLGLLDDGAQLPGGIRLSRAAARDAAQPLMARLGLSHQELAASVYRIAVANMAEAIRSVTVRRGYDPRDYALFACGGAGPLMAGPLAQELQLTTVLVPPDPGVFSAFGLTAAGLRMDFARAIEQGSTVVHDRAVLAGIVAELGAQARQAFADLDVALEDVDMTFTADARYVGQGFELRVPFGARDVTPQQLADRFHQVHEERYGHGFPNQTMELTAIRLSAATAATELLSRWQSLPSDVGAAEREVHMGGPPLRVPVRDRAALDVDERLSGPWLCVEATSSTWVPQGWRAGVDKHGLLALEKEDES